MARYQNADEILASLITHDNGNSLPVTIRNSVAPAPYGQTSGASVSAQFRNSEFGIEADALIEKAIRLANEHRVPVSLDFEECRFGVHSGTVPEISYPSLYSPRCDCNASKPSEVVWVISGPRVQERNAWDCRDSTVSCPKALDDYCDARGLQLVLTILFVLAIGVFAAWSILFD